MLVKRAVARAVFGVAAARPRETCGDALRAVFGVAAERTAERATALVFAVALDRITGAALRDVWTAEADRDAVAPRAAVAERAVILSETITPRFAVERFERLFSAEISLASISLVFLPVRFCAAAEVFAADPPLGFGRASAYKAVPMAHIDKIARMIFFISPRDYSIKTEIEATKKCAAFFRLRAPPANR
ncbi:MAG: hypothetical protein LBL21_05190 [Rickettsiales bacterium]|jgi:hypothetical protein|nr:hypothetical protein [Rickettsiales bacterium]